MDSPSVSNTPYVWSDGQRYCLVHPCCQWGWFKAGDRKSQWGCEDCYNKVRAQSKHDVLAVPRVKFCQNWHRTREYTELERRAPGGKAKKPKW